MMAHVVYPAVDTRPAGQSPVWIGDILRGELGFRGLVFSDDVSMAAAGQGGVAERVHAHLDAGCDLVLACQAEAFETALAAVANRAPCSAERVARLRGEVGARWDALVDNPQRDDFIARVTALDHEDSA
jgi:beta-N-acetylhexosaminidase